MAFVPVCMNGLQVDAEIIIISCRKKKEKQICNYCLFVIVLDSGQFLEEA